MKTKFGFVSKLIACAVALGFASSAAADEYPSKPIRLIVPYSAGGTTDTLSRAYAKSLSGILKQPIVVENKPGAGGNLGVDAVAKAAPDGYTLGLTASGPLVINPTLYTKIPYDPAKDLAPITLIAIVPSVIAANPGAGIKTLGDLIRQAKASPDKFSFASGGSGTTQHLSGEMLKVMANINLTHIPYKGDAPAVTDALGGQVQVVIGSVTAVLPHVKTGKLIPLAVTSSKRNPAMPDVPTVEESGLPGYQSAAWYGIIAPAGTPKEIVKKLNNASVNAINSPDVSERIAAAGGTPITNSPDEFARFVLSEIPRWAKFIKQSGAKPE
jgi:tripartite-type tricarboxylate transporter receptor subunit TctC